MSAASTVYIAALCWGSSVKYGKFESEKPMSMPFFGMLIYGFPVLFSEDEKGKL